MLAAAVCIYFFNRKLVLKEAALTEAQEHQLALPMAVFTALYLFYLPISGFGEFEAGRYAPGFF